MNPWYQNEVVDATPIISSRARLARNLRRYPFGGINDEQSHQLIEEATDALSHSFPVVSLADKSNVEKRRLLERHVISPEFLKTSNPKALMMEASEQVCIMVNEEDHIRIQAICSGDNIDSAWDTANRVDDLLEERVQYAFDKDYGYLTACPTNTGTGLRASFMAHLPMLERTGQLRNLLAAVSKFGMTLRGIYGEGTEPMGHIFQISNQITMGKSESEIISALKKITGQIIENENFLREKACAEKRLEIEDEVCRAYGTLAYARRLSAKEAMELLSAVRLGFISGVLEAPKPKQTMYDIMMSIQSGGLQSRAGREMSEAERDEYRATWLRSIFNNKA
ncbi:MAG: protein arginine kinase [Clostridiales bacterium]|jgi:protein arginine kinase|nr:protein arginine kinase [Clostridiales bacterium]